MKISPQFFDIGSVLICSLILIFFSYCPPLHSLKRLTSPVLGLIAILTFGLLSSIYIYDIKNIVWCMFGLVSVIVFYNINYSKIKFNIWSIVFCIICSLLFFTDIFQLDILQTSSLVSTSNNETNHAYGLAAYTAIYSLLFIILIPFNSNKIPEGILILFPFSIVGLTVLFLSVRSPLFAFFVCTIFIVLKIRKLLRHHSRIIFLWIPHNVFLFDFFIVYLGESWTFISKYD
jgi:hypothetical protein